MESADGGEVMYLDNKKVFIAGATGMVGSGIIKYILEHCPKTTIRAVYYDTRPFINHPRVEYIHGNLLFAEECRNLVGNCQCAIMAAAKTANANTINTSPEKFISKNIIMNMNLLEAFYTKGVKRAIYIGSATLYQDMKRNIKEGDLDMNEDPQSAYLGFGWVIRYIEKLCYFWHERYNMEILVARASNVFGPFGKFNPESSNFVPAIIRKAVDRMNPFKVWGSPNVARDVIYIDDFARAIVTMLNAEKVRFGIFNIGSGKETKVKDVVKWSLKCAGYTPKKIVYESDKPSTAKSRVLNCTKVYKVFKWKPQISIEEGIKRTTEWGI